jgi:hypothetical protein
MLCRDLAAGELLDGERKCKTGSSRTTTELVEVRSIDVEFGCNLITRHPGRINPPCQAILSFSRSPSGTFRAGPHARLFAPVSVFVKKNNEALEL